MCAWSWSHSPEAYEKARKNLGKKSIKWVSECLAEWYCHEYEERDKARMKKVDDIVWAAENAVEVAKAAQMALAVLLKQEYAGLVSYHWTLEYRAVKALQDAGVSVEGMALPDKVDAECFESGAGDPMKNGMYEQWIKTIKEDIARLGKEWACDCIWERAEKLRTCDNGGYDPWMCPNSCHSVEW
jgi:hypothetical protein